VSALFTQCPGDKVQTGTGKVDPARKFKCTTAARENIEIEVQVSMKIKNPRRDSMKNPRARRGGGCSLKELRLPKTGMIIATYINDSIHFFNNSIKKNELRNELRPG